MHAFLVLLYYLSNTVDAMAVKEKNFEIRNVSRGLRASHEPNPTVKDRSPCGPPEGPHRVEPQPQMPS